MKTNFTEITVKIQPFPEYIKKHENILANASVTLRDEDGSYFTISGFTIWKSKLEGRNVTEPSSARFKYCLFERGFWRRLKAEILKAYDYHQIPVVE